LKQARRGPRKKADLDSAIARLGYLPVASPGIAPAQRTKNVLSRRLARNTEQFSPPLLFSLVHPPIFFCGFAVALRLAAIFFATTFLVTIQPRKPRDHA
jgi:hypothetical protein